MPRCFPGRERGHGSFYSLIGHDAVRLVGQIKQVVELRLAQIKGDFEVKRPDPVKGNGFPELFFHDMKIHLNGLGKHIIHIHINLFHGTPLTYFKREVFSHGPGQRSTDGKQMKFFYLALGPGTCLNTRP